MSSNGHPKDANKSVPERVLGKEAFRAPPPKRFYKTVQVSPVIKPGGEMAYGILLDGRPVKTPKKHPLEVLHKGLAEAIAAEWARADKVIDPALMPFTRMANTALDAVAGSKDLVAADIVSFAGSDHLCYRAADDDRLARRQASHWDSIIGWAAARLDARFIVTKGVMPVGQPQQALSAFAAELARFDAFGLTALHVMTTLSGSAILALAHGLGAITAEAAWLAAHVDEDVQIEQWGSDSEAEQRRAARWQEFKAASQMIEFTKTA